MTMWEQYLQGHDLRVIARLTEPPLSRSGLAADRYLGLILIAFDRLIEQARAIIVQGEVNVFNLHRVNNFVSRFSSIEVVMTKLEKRAMIRPLLSKLQEGTYRRYKQAWKRLICFIYRLAYQRQRQALHYTLTDPQSTALEKLVAAAQALSVNLPAGSNYRRGASEQQLQAELDQACLCFCITLLDHRLLSPVYDSIVVGFLAVQGIDVQNNCFYNASCYITNLSAFVKMAQLLVLRQAVAAREAGECDHPAQALEEMQERFMVYGTRSPMNWIQKLRTYGKRIADTTTGLGHIVWSEDAEELSYKGLELSMTGLKAFVAQQVRIAEAQLHSLLYVCPEEESRIAIPAFDLCSFKDNPAVSTPGWSFLRDPRNTALQGYERWLLNRITGTDWLWKNFLVEVESARWRRLAAERYLNQNI